MQAPTDTVTPALARPESKRSLLWLIAAILAVSAGSQWWVWHRDQQIGREIASIARDGDILLLASDTCTYCHEARGFMKRHEVRFSECSIERDADCAARYAALKTKTTPMTIVRGDVQEGFMPAKVLERLRRT